MNTVISNLGVDALKLAKTFAVSFAGTVSLGWSGVVASVAGGHLSSARDLLLALVISAASTGAHAVAQAVDSYINRSHQQTPAK